MAAVSGFIIAAVVAVIAIFILVAVALVLVRIALALLLAMAAGGIIAAISSIWIDDAWPGVYGSQHPASLSCDRVDVPGQQSESRSGTSKYRAKGGSASRTRG